MAGVIRRWYGRLGLQIALIFVLVAVGAVVVASVVAALTVYSQADEILARQEASETSAAALGAAISYTPKGWAAALEPVIAVADRSGAEAQVRDASGRVVRSSPGYAKFPQGPARTAPVVIGRKRVGSITLRFGDRGIGALVGHFEAQRWRARLSAAGFGALFALVVALLVAPLLAGPVDRLVRAARARGGGEPDARVGRVRGFRDIRELAASFDQMADNTDKQDQVRRNLVADIAHELRTPIAVLQASTEGMVDGVQQLTVGQAESLHDEAVRLGQMVDDLQRLAAAEAAAVQLTLVRCDLAEVAAAAADSLATVAGGAGIRLVRRLRSVPVRCDSPRIREVVTNLLTNAVKFTGPGGEVVLETAPHGEQAMLRVSDTGAGIRPEDLPRLTERFFRGCGSAGVNGSGIGLTVVNELVRAHHGTIAFASRPGEGTDVTVILPTA
jgi:two-component system, OmpR family, sensor histidine kinase BaeS